MLSRFFIYPINATSCSESYASGGPKLNAPPGLDPRGLLWCGDPGCIIGCKISAPFLAKLDIPNFCAFASYY